MRQYTREKYEKRRNVTLVLWYPSCVSHFPTPSKQWAIKSSLKAFYAAVKYILSSTIWYVMFYFKHWWKSLMRVQYPKCANFVHQIRFIMVCVYILVDSFMGHVGEIFLSHNLSLSHDETSCAGSCLYNGILYTHFRATCEGAAVAEWLSSWLAEHEDRGSIPGLTTWIFRDWLSPASKSRYC